MADDSSDSWETADDMADELEGNDAVGPSPSTKQEEQIDEDPVESREKGKWGCEHYPRRCLLVAPCCTSSDGRHTAFSCRHCHNSASESGDVKLQHMLDRKAVQEIDCALCLTRQV